MSTRQIPHLGLIWRARRVAAGLRQQDIAQRVGISTTKLSAIERGEQIPSDMDRRAIERLLPELPILSTAEQGDIEGSHSVRRAPEREV